MPRANLKPESLRVFFTRGLAAAAKVGSHILHHLVRIWTFVHAWLRRHSPSRMLSHSIAYTESELVPALLQESPYARWLSTFRRLLNPTLVILVTAAILFALIMTDPLHWLTNAVSWLPREEPFDFAWVFSTSAQVLAAVTGLVLPLVILLVGYYGRMTASILGRYLKSTQLLNVLALSLIVAFLNIVGLSLAATGLLDVKPRAVATLMTLLYLTAADMAVTVLVVGRTLSVASAETLPNVLKEALFSELLKSCRQEFHLRLMRLAAIQVLTGSNLQWHPMPPVSEEDWTAINSARIGQVKDMDLVRLEAVSASLPSVHADEAGRLLLLALPGDSVQKGSSLAYLSTGQHDQHLVRMIRDTIVIRPLAKGIAEAGLLLDQLKDSTAHAARSHSEALFESLFALYAHILELNASLIEPPPFGPFDIFREWNPIMQARGALYDVLEVAVANGYARHCARQLFRAATFAVERKHQRALNLILEFFPTIYLESRRANDEAGVDRSCRYLSPELTNHIVRSAPTSGEVTENDVQQFYAMLNAAIYGMMAVLRQTIQQRDIVTYRTISKRLDAGEILGLYTPSAVLWHRRFELDQMLRASTIDNPGSQAAAEALHAVDRMLNLPRELGSSLLMWRFVTGAYLLSFYAAEAMPLGTLIDFLEPVQHSFDTLTKLATGFDVLIQEDPHFLGRRTIFDQIEDTQRVGTSDPEHVHLRFYVVLGLRLLSSTSADIPLPDIRMARDYLDRIEILCQEVQQETLWKSFIGADDLGNLVTRFLEMHQVVAERLKRRDDERAAEAPLEITKVAGYQEAAYRSWRDARLLPALLARFGKLSEVDRFQQSMQSVAVHSTADKRSFLSAYPEREAEELGSVIGSALAHRLSNTVLGDLVSQAEAVAAEQDGQDLDAYFENGTSALIERGFAPSVIIVPVRVLYQDLEHLPGFVAPFERPVPDAVVGLLGYYRELPIVNWMSSDSILVVDLDRASVLSVQKPQAEIRLLSESERLVFKAAHPDNSDVEIALKVMATAETQYTLDMAAEDAIVQVSLSGWQSEIEDGPEI